MAAHKLPNLARFLIVKALAHGHTPTEVVKLIHNLFGITITRQTIQHYDPTLSGEIAPHLREYFLQEFRNYKEDLQNCPLESLAFRQMRRQKILEKCDNNPDLAMRVLESARKDSVGEFISSRAPRRHF